MPQADVRASGLDVLARTGSPLTVTLTWPAGYLVGRSFTSSVGGTAITPGIASNVMTLSLTGAQTTALGNGRHALLVTDTTGDDVVRIAGRVLLGTSSTDSPDSTVTVLTDTSVSVDVSVAVGLGLPLPSGTATVGYVPAVTDDDPLTLAWTNIGTQVELDAEAAARAAADTTLQANITAEAALARNADNLTSGTVADARIASTIARDSEVTAAIAAQHTADIGTFVAQGDLVINVQDYGAVADGVADDTAEIQAAIDAAPAGALVYFPQGTYLVSSTIKLRGGRRYMGAGTATSAAATIKAANASNLDAVVAANAWATNATSADSPVVVEQLAINGNKANQSGGTGIGLVLLNYYSKVVNVYVTGAYGDGIVISDTNKAGTVVSGTCVENRVIDCTIYQPGGRGIAVLDTSASGRCTDGYLSGNVVATPTGTGIFNGRAAGWFIRDNHVYACVGRGIDLRNCWATFATNNEVDGFGNTTGGTQIGFNMEMIAGRPSVAMGNLAAANESNNVTGTFVYLRVANTSAVTTNIVLIGNIARRDAGTAAASTGLSLQASSGVLNVTEASTLIDGPDTSRSTGGTVNYPGAYVEKAWRPTPTIKTAVQSVNNSTTLVNDTHLAFAVGASEKWVAEFVLFVVNASSNTPDIDIAVTVPSGATVMYNATGPRSGTDDRILENSLHATASGTELRVGVVGTTAMIVVRCYVSTGATAGTVQLQWAQGTVGASDTTLQIGSYVEPKRVA